MNITLKELKLTPKRMEICKRLHLNNSEDILCYYPFRYQEYNEDAFNTWKIKDYVHFEALIISRPYTYKFGYRKAVTKFKVEVDNEVIEVSIFNRPWIRDIDDNKTINIVGQYIQDRKVTLTSYYFGNKKELGIVPIYSIKEGITNKNIVDIISKTFSMIKTVDDKVPSQYREKYHLMSRDRALRTIHFPGSKDELMLSLRTLKYEEFLAFNTAILMTREDNKGIKVDGKVFDNDKINQLIKALPFSLTDDQKMVVDDILKDLSGNKMMNRLVQGDVGSGKTIVAIIALYASALANKQGAMMAPTEILAHQHFENISELLKPYNINVGLLYSDLKSDERKKVLEKLKNHELDIIIGTHSLFQDEVEYHDLGLVITDEQHRFGVNQRKKLKDKGNKVDFLLMSATPIPRTLASTLYGDMDISTIKTMPQGRKQVITELVNSSSINDIKSSLLEQLDKGRQVYLLCNAIEKGERLVRNVVDVYDGLVKHKFFNDYRVGLLHGKMSSEDKQSVMEEFALGKIKILVTTTVIEVGVNVPNATVMVIYDASYFGLSQLHQLRGRIIRGNQQGYCYLLSDKQLEASERLKLLEKTTDGFEIAMYDLKQRGPGDLLGLRQSGLPSLILGDLFEDGAIINQSKLDALEIIQNQDIQENQVYLDEIIKINETNLSYVD